MEIDQTLFNQVFNEAIGDSKSGVGAAKMAEALCGNATFVRISQIMKDTTPYLKALTVTAVLGFQAGRAYERAVAGREDTYTGCCTAGGTSQSVAR